MSCHAFPVHAREECNVALIIRCMYEITMTHTFFRVRSGGAILRFRGNEDVKRKYFLKFVGQFII